MQCTEKADSDNDEETRNAQVEAVKVLLNDSFNPDLRKSIYYINVLCVC